MNPAGGALQGAVDDVVTQLVPPRWAVHVTDPRTREVLATVDADRVQGTASLGTILPLVEWDDRATPWARAAALTGMARIGAAVRRRVEGD